MFLSANLLASTQEINRTQQKQSYTVTKYTTTQNEHKKLKPDLVAFYDLRHINLMGLFSKK